MSAYMTEGYLLQGDDDKFSVFVLLMLIVTN